MSELMQSTAWRMDMPARYGVFHLVFTAILLAVTILAVWCLRRTNEKQNRVVLGLVGGFLLATEVYKIVFHLTVDPYDWGFFGCFPFQLCSVPMYLCIVCALCKNERINGWLYECMFCVNMFGGIMAFLEPSGIQHTYVTLTIHAYIWHMMLVFVGLYLYASRRVCMKPRAYFKGIAVFFGTCVLAQVFNLVFAGEVNCFYISPYVQSPLAVFKDIYAACGWVVNMVLFILGLSIASAAVYGIGYALRMRANKGAQPEKQTV